MAVPLGIAAQTVSRLTKQEFKAQEESQALIERMFVNGDGC